MAKESIPLGLKYSCMLKDTAENDVLQESILRGSLLFSQKLLLIFFDTPMTLNISKDSHLTHINSWLSAKLFIRNCGVWGGGIFRKTEAPKLKSCSWKNHLKHTSSWKLPYTPASDKLDPPQGYFFLLFVQHSRRLGLVFACIWFSIRNTLNSLDNILLVNPIGSGYCPQAVSDITALGTSKNILWFSWIQENVQ